MINYGKQDSRRLMMKDQQYSCPICSTSSVVGGELPHAWIGICNSKACGCRFAIAKTNLLDNLEQIHSYRREHIGMDSPTLIFERLLPRLKSLSRLNVGSKLLDFGAGAAPLYPIAREHGFQYTGVEFDGTAREAALATHGIALYKDINELPDEYRCDIVIMSEVIEHLPDPLSVLSMCRQRLNPNGLLYLSTPNARSLRARVEGPKWRNYQNMAHLLYFTEKSLALLLSKAGFSSIQRTRVQIPYPAHSKTRKFFQYLLVTFGWDGALRFLARS
jgi:2-polyprenyl-3-methyl-5-hydroxy-6-metoxy-1,4-benzoquinol methylase